MTGHTPYSGCSDAVTLLKIQAGEIPQRPSDGIPGMVWEFLEKCWSGNPAKRPSTTQVYETFSKLRSPLQALHIPEGRLAMEELPGRLKLQAQGIKISLNKPKKRRFSVRFKYGNKDHTTSPTRSVVAGGEHTWFVFRSSPLLLPPLTLGQERPRNLVDRNQ